MIFNMPLFYAYHCSQAFWLPDQSGDPDEFAKEFLAKKAGAN